MFENMAKRKKKSGNDRITKNDEKNGEIVLQKKPLICLIDIEEDIKEILHNNGLNVTSGELGTPVRVPNKRFENGHKCLPNHNFPANLHEYDVIILNLSKKIPTTYDLDEHTKNMQQGFSDTFFISEYPETLFNPIAYSTFQLKILLSERSQSKRIIIVFADELNVTEYQLMKETNSRTDKDQSITLTNYSFSDKIPKSNNKYGQELRVENNTILNELLNRHISGTTYNIIFEHTELYNSRLNKRVKDKEIIPLMRNSHDEIVSFIRFFEEDVLIVLPKIKNKSSFLEELLTNQLPSHFPDIFPYNSEFKWLEEEAYLLPNALKLAHEKKSVIEDYDIKMLEVMDKLQKNHKEYEFLHHLLIETGSDLVKTVENFLRWLGFSNVKNMDETDIEPKEEDLQVEIGDELLVIEVKGIGGTSTDGECRQIGKIIHRRRKERNDFGVYGLYIVNHQRYQSPLRRINPPFDSQKIKDAEYEDRGLLTTWQLFNLYYSIENDYISKEDARKALLNVGLIKFTPSNCIPLGKAKEIYYGGKVIILDLSTKIEINNELIIKNGFKYKRAIISEITVNDSKVNEAESGEIGIKIDNIVKKSDELFLKNKD